MNCNQEETSNLYDQSWDHSRNPLSNRTDCLRSCFKNRQSWDWLCLVVDSQGKRKRQEFMRNTSMWGLYLDNDYCLTCSGWSCRCRRWDSEASGGLNACGLVEGFSNRSTYCSWEPCVTITTQIILSFLNIVIHADTTDWQENKNVFKLCLISKWVREGQ